MFIYWTSKTYNFKFLECESYISRCGCCSSAEISMERCCFQICQVKRNTGYINYFWIFYPLFYLYQSLMQVWTTMVGPSATCYSSLSDRKPVETEDEIIVMLVPDYQMLEYVQKIAYDLSDDSVIIYLFIKINSSLWLSIS